MDSRHRRRGHLEPVCCGGAPDSRRAGGLDSPAGAIDASALSGYRSDMEVLLSEAQSERLEEIARAQGRDQSILIREAVERFLDEQAWIANEVALGLAQCEEDQLIEDEVVRDRIRARSLTS